jgi:hypothetical protein
MARSQILFAGEVQQGGNLGEWRRRTLGGELFQDVFAAGNRAFIFLCFAIPVGIFVGTAFRHSGFSP